MELELALIRHGRVQNDKKRLIGITDEPLGREGEQLIRSKLEQGDYPEAELVFSSTLLRCYETARMIYQNVPTVVLKELRALDYGEFDGMCVDELSADENFLEWANRKGVMACPGGEEPYALQARSIAAFRRILDEMAGKGLNRGSVISHKMIIMEILQRYHVPRSHYKEWEIPHGGGYILRYDTIRSTVEIIGSI